MNPSKNTIKRMFRTGPPKSEHAKELPILDYLGWLYYIGNHAGDLYKWENGQAMQVIPHRYATKTAKARRRKQWILNTN